MRDADVVLIGRADADRVLIFDPAANRPVERSRAEFDAAWIGRLILPTASATGASGTLGFGWFLPGMKRHAGILMQTAAASLFVRISVSPHRCSA